MSVTNFERLLSIVFITVAGWLIFSRVFENELLIVSTFAFHDGRSSIASRWVDFEDGLKKRECPIPFSIQRFFHDVHFSFERISVV